MLTDADASPRGLKRLVHERLIEAIARAHGKSIHLAGLQEVVAERYPYTPESPSETHPFIEMCLCACGEAEIQAGAGLRRLKEGEVMVIPGGMIHSASGVHAVTIPPATAFSRLFWIAVLPYGCILNLCESAHGVHRSTPRQLFMEHHVFPCILDLVMELNNGKEDCDALARFKLLEALTYLCRGQEVQDLRALNGVNLPGAAEPDSNSFSGRVKEFIAHNFDSRLSLDRIAQAVASNKSHLCRRFKSDTGFTLGEYLTRVRIDTSKRLLLTSLTISDIARLAGFDDPYYFSRIFRKMTGLSPTDFRTSHRPDTYR